VSTGGGNKAIVAAFLANLGIAIAKFVGFLITGSSSMLAESIHSAADTGNQALLAIGQRRAKRAPDELHQFGYGRERYFYSFVVAMVLFSLGSLFAIYEGIEKIRHPEHVESVEIAIAVLLVAVVLEGFSFRTAIAESNVLRGSSTWREFIRRAKVPELPVVLLEDFGALIGLVVALVALLLAWKVDPVFDGVGTLVIGFLLGIIAVVLAIEMKSLVIGEAVDPAVESEIVRAMELHPQVERVIHMRTEHLGPDEVLVAAKLAFGPALDLRSLAATIDEVEVAIRTTYPAARLVYLEPDLDRT
jgi:cation diffusion facilitator family transporter